MSENSLRSVLRAHTTEIHMQIDAMTPGFEDAGAYCAFLSKTFAFREALEPALAACPLWQPDILVPHLAEDLAQLGCETPPLGGKPPYLPSLSADLGALYVLEGSSVGARVLYQRACALGMSEEFGASALSRQSRDRQRWKNFVHALDHARGIDVEEAKGAAKRVFEFAFFIYSGALRESA